MTSYTVEELDALDDDTHFGMACISGVTLRLCTLQREMMRAAHARWVDDEGLDPELYDASEYTDFGLYSEMRINQVGFPRHAIFTLADLDAMTDDEHFDLAGTNFAMLAISDEQREEMAEVRDEFLDDLASEGIVDQDPPSAELTNAAIYHDLRINGIDFERIEDAYPPLVLG